jgi:hypothetical protein
LLAVKATEQLIHNPFLALYSQVADVLLLVIIVSLDYAAQHCLHGGWQQKQIERRLTHWDTPIKSGKDAGEHLHVAELVVHRPNAANDIVIAA